MEIQRIILDDTDTEEVTIALVRMAKEMLDFEFFFHVNKINTFSFQRINDVIVEGDYFRYFFPVFEGYSKETQTCYRFISNKSSESFQKKEINELFIEEQNVKYLLNNFHDTDYIISSSDSLNEFSVILLPENLTFQIQEILLTSDEELYHILQYYE